MPPIIVWIGLGLAAACGLMVIGACVILSRQAQGWQTPDDRSKERRQSNE